MDLIIVNLIMDDVSSSMLVPSYVNLGGLLESQNINPEDVNITVNGNVASLTANLNEGDTVVINKKKASSGQL